MIKNEKLQKNTINKNRLQIFFEILFFSFSLFLFLIIRFKEQKKFMKVKNHLNKNQTELMKSLIKKRMNKMSTTNITTFYLPSVMRTGNYIMALSNAIYYCEILECKYIITSNSYSQNFNTKPVIYKKKNITILPYKKVNCTEKEIYCSGVFFLYYHYNRLQNGLRYNIFKDEFISNFKYMKTNDDDLYIHIRSGDIFWSKHDYSYAQPPFCFYEYILDKFKFKNIYITTEKYKNNPVIKKLIKKYPNSQLISSNIKHDMNLIVHAKNLVISNSSFSRVLTELSFSLKNLFFFNYIGRVDKYLGSLSKDNKKKYNIYKMDPTDEYLQKMKRWEHTKIQIELLEDSKCNQKLYKDNAIY